MASPGSEQHLRRVLRPLPFTVGPVTDALTTDVPIDEPPTALVHAATDAPVTDEVVIDEQVIEGSTSDATERPGPIVQTEDPWTNFKRYEIEGQHVLLYFDEASLL